MGLVLLPAPAGRHAADAEQRRRSAPGEQDSGFPAVAGDPDRGPGPGAQPGGALVSVPSGAVNVSGAAAPRSGGTLELAEPPAAGPPPSTARRCSPSRRPAGRWAQAFRLPAGGGTLDISHNQLGRTLIVVLEALALLVVASLGLPGARVPGESARRGRAERPGGGGRRRARPGGDRGDSASPGRSRGACRGEDEEASRGSRLSRRAAAADAGQTRSEPDQCRPGRCRPGRCGPDRAGRAGAGRPGGRRAAAPGAGRPGRARTRDRALSGPGAGARRAPHGTKTRTSRLSPAPTSRQRGAGALTPFLGLAVAWRRGVRIPGWRGFLGPGRQPHHAEGPGGAYPGAGGAPPAAARAGGGTGGWPGRRPGRRQWPAQTVSAGPQDQERSAPEPETAGSPAAGAPPGRGGAGASGAGGPGSRPGAPGASTRRISTPEPATAVGRHRPAPARPRDTSGPYPSSSYASGQYPSGQYRVVVRPSRVRQRRMSQQTVPRRGFRATRAPAAWLRQRWLQHGWLRRSRYRRPVTAVPGRAVRLWQGGYSGAGDSAAGYGSGEFRRLAGWRAAGQPGAARR